LLYKYISYLTKPSRYITIQLCEFIFRKIKLLTALTVIINNIYNVEFLEYDVSQLPVMKNLLINCMQYVYKHIHCMQYVYTHT